MRQFVQRNAIVLAAIACALIILVAVSGRSSFNFSVPMSEVNYTIEPVQEAPIEPPPEEQTEVEVKNENGGKAIITAALILIGLLLLTGAARAAHKFLQSKKEPDPVARDGADETLEDDLAELLIPTVSIALDDGLDALRRGGSPRNAIVEAWISLERAVEDSGIERDRSDTPTEFTMAALQSLPLTEAKLTELLSLFHRARFTTQDLGEEQINQAIECVETLRSDIAAFDGFRGGQS